MSELQNLPSLDVLLQQKQTAELINHYGREITVKALRFSLDSFRDAIKNGAPSPSHDSILTQAEQQLNTWLRPSLVPVINASGVILHTNLGRAPLSEETIVAMQTVSSSYSTLEYDLPAGKRGKRSTHAEGLLKLLTGVESALVVNNNAAAVLLVLSALANRKRALIANSQLVEIGGGFRVPDVMRQSGAKLVAVGTTNRVHLSDYQTALKEPAALVLTAHHSNFKIIGFTAEPELADLAMLCHKAGLPLVYDLGSGALLDTASFGLAHEPTVQEALEAGADIICFSGDKLLGGPQAGIIIGKKDLMDKVKAHPLARAVRADKLCLAGIAATLTHYLKGEALEKIPAWRMISRDVEAIRNQAESWKETLKAGEVIPGSSMVGGGSLPGESQPTFLFALNVKSPDRFLEKLRGLPVPVIARIEDDRVVFDPRTVLPFQESILLEELNSLL
ncbi:MAG: L-seryl-tRNA(Sec) selenium transferase [Pelolinea sp.]|nr:L-seryl-tRNA(Sec) selenium transferase [Pelolinea sp.]